MLTFNIRDALDWVLASQISSHFNMIPARKAVNTHKIKSMEGLQDSYRCKVVFCDAPYCLVLY